MDILKYNSRTWEPEVFLERWTSATFTDSISEGAKGEIVFEDIKNSVRNLSVNDLVVCSENTIRFYVVVQTVINVDNNNTPTFTARLLGLEEIFRRKPGAPYNRQVYKYAPDPNSMPTENFASALSDAIRDGAVAVNPLADVHAIKNFETMTLSSGTTPKTITLNPSFTGSLWDLIQMGVDKLNENSLYIYYPTVRYSTTTKNLSVYYNSVSSSVTSAYRKSFSDQNGDFLDYKILDNPPRDGVLNFADMNLADTNAIKSGTIFNGNKIKNGYASDVLRNYNVVSTVSGTIYERSAATWKAFWDLGGSKLVELTPSSRMTEEVKRMPLGGEVTLSFKEYVDTIAHVYIAEHNYSQDENGFVYYPTFKVL